jgi:hypothetical protein
MLASRSLRTLVGGVCSKRVLPLLQCANQRVPLKLPRLGSLSRPSILHRTLLTTQLVSLPKNTLHIFGAGPSKLVSAPRRLNSTESRSAIEALPELTTEQGRKPVAMWLFAMCGMVFIMVVLGGVTRLTESGLSMVEWRPAGFLPPLSHEEWKAEFELYKQYPEYKLSAFICILLTQ